MQRWLSEYHPSEVSGSERMLEVPEAGGFDVYAAEIGGESDWDLST